MGLAELAEELIELSPFLHQVYQKGWDEGRVAELRTLVREVLRERFAEIGDEGLASIETMEDADSLHTLALALASVSDSVGVRRALAEALAREREIAVAKGREYELHLLIDDIVRTRFSKITTEELMEVYALTNAGRLHTLVIALASAPDMAAARQALAEALR